MGIPTRLGRIIRVKNLKTKVFSHESNSYLAVLVKNENGIDTQCLLFTDGEINKAIDRAIKNKEDLIERSWKSKLLD